MAEDVRVYLVDDGWVVSEGRTWLSGVFPSAEAARLAALLTPMIPTNASEEARALEVLKHEGGQNLFKHGDPWYPQAAVVRAMLAFAKPSLDTVSGEVGRAYAAGVEAAAQAVIDHARSCNETGRPALFSNIVPVIRSLASPDALEG